MTLPKKGKILVVDDDRLVLATLAHGLAQAGHDVVDADNGDDAILLAREHRPDLALLDIRMQGKSGFDVAEYLRDYGRVPFIFLSAFADDDTVAKVTALGAVAYLVKPLDIAHILPIVDRALTQRAQAEASLTATSGPSGGGSAADSGVPADPVVWMAVGALMQRESHSRAAALDRLYRLAAAAGLAPADQALRLIEALEVGIASG